MGPRNQSPSKDSPSHRQVITFLEHSVELNSTKKGSYGWTLGMVTPKLI